MNDNSKNQDTFDDSFEQDNTTKIDVTNDLETEISDYNELIGDLEELDDLEEFDEIEVANGVAIGIDLGTTNSVVMYYDNGTVRNVKIGSDYVVPSTIYFEGPDKLLFGRQAVNRRLFRPQSGVRYFKRKLGDLVDPYFEIEYGKEVEKDVTSVKAYVIDTNILINYPETLSQFNDQERIYLPNTVVSELNYQAEKKDDLKFQAEKALQLLEEYEHLIINETADPSLVADDIFVASSSANDQNDINILSIAIKHQDENPILITNDYALRQHAKSANLEVKNYDEFRIFKTMDTENGQKFKVHAQQLTQIFLKYLREGAMNALKENVTKVAIGVPVEFTPAQEDATRDAALAAGFEEVELIRESFAAAIAYGLDVNIGKKLLVYDWGGGTFDVSIIEILADQKFRPLGHDGDLNLGGEDITNTVAQKIAELIDDEYQVYIPQIDGLSEEEQKKNEINLYKATEDCKVFLTTDSETDVQVDIFIAPEVKEKYSVKVTRREFENWIGPFVKRTIDKLQNALSEAGLGIDDIDITVLAGGSSLIPLVQTTIEQQFGFKPHYNKDVSRLIAEGAAIFVGSGYIGPEDLPIETTNHHFGVLIDKIDFKNLIPVGTELPWEETTIAMPLVDLAEELVINVYRASKNSPARFTTDEGMEHIEKLTISNIPPRPKTEVAVDITFELTNKYGLSVQALVRDRKTGEILNKGHVHKQTSY